MINPNFNLDKEKQQKLRLQLIDDNRYWKQHTNSLLNLEIIDFYHPDNSNPYRFLANFYPSPMIIDGIKYLTVEHYYQSHKFKTTDDKIFKQIQSSETPDQAKKLSRIHKEKVRKDWDKIKVDIMKKATIQKFLQNKELLRMFLLTDTAILRERIPPNVIPCDTFWGWNKKYGGQNMAGKVLMSVRSLLGGFDVFGVTYSKLLMREGKTNIVAVFKGIQHLAIIVPPKTNNTSNNNNTNNNEIEDTNDDIDNEIMSSSQPIVRLHSRCWTGDVFNSMDCDCRHQLWSAISQIESSPNGGVLLYLDQEGRGLGIVPKIRGYCLLHNGIDTVDAYSILGLPVDTRSFRDAAEMLKRLGIQNIKLLTNNPYKLNGLRKSKINVTKCIRMTVKPYNLNKISSAYFKSKIERMGHHSALMPNNTSNNNNNNNDTKSKL